MTHSRTNVIRSFVQVVGSIGRVLPLVPFLLVTMAAHASVRPEKLYRIGLELAQKTHYIEALELFDEARLILERSGQTDSRIYGDLLLAIAESKIKGRLHQAYSALYVKTALKDVQRSNEIIKKLPDVPARRLAEGYYLEGFIHKRFFMRTREARQLFERAVKVDPGFAPAKRELSEMLSEPDKED